MHDVRGNVIDRSVGRLGLRGENAADDGHGVTDLGPNVEAEDDGNAELDVRQDGAGDVGAAENTGADSPPR